MVTTTQKFAAALIIVALLSISGTYLVTTQFLIPPETGVTTIIYGASDLLISPSEVIYEIASENYLEPKGITWKRVGMSGYTPVVQSLVAGTVDIGHVSFVDLLKARDAGADLKGFYMNDIGIPYMMIVPTEITDIMQLEGKKFAYHRIGSYTEITAKIILEAEGVDLDKVEWLIIPGSENRRAALIAGEIDGSMVEVRDAVMLEATGNFHILANAIDYGDFMHIPLVVRATWLEKPENQELLDKIVIALMKTTRDVYDDPDMWADACLTFMPEYPIADLKEANRIYIDAKVIALNGGITRERFDKTITFHIEVSEFLEHTYNYDDVVYIDAISNALDELGEDTRGLG